jgi:hypothetical protein
MKKAIIKQHALPALMHGLPEEDQDAIAAVDGVPIQLVCWRYTNHWDVQLTFEDASGTRHDVWVNQNDVDIVEESAVQ